MITDVSTFPDLDDSGRGIDDDTSILECLRRGLSMPAGTLAYAPEQGFDLRALLSQASIASDASRIEGAIEDQALRDERVGAARCSVTSVAPFRATVRLLRADGTTPIALTIAASDLSLEILRA